ncbi:arginase family protein [Spirosoma validum]|uniref:Arginase family protein n=1 Tax=Spirosoma validum TaxID=2771355 RepID=A0A927B2T4_9BACT|nr:arginase family protein [Spirosoma validum]MBD2754291.1 arginase family protein [Spirosoma validum]
MRQLVVIEAPSNLGLKASSHHREPGVNRLPDWVRQQGLYTHLGEDTQTITVLPASYSGKLDSKTGIRQADDIALYSQQLARTVKQTIDQQSVTLVIGGDCSILLGCLLGLSQRGRYGLFFLDGHTDFAWPGLSQTGGAAGMDLALVTGHGPLKLTNINGRKPYVREEHVWSVGNRDEDPDYVAAIRSSQIQYRDLNRLRDDGPETCVSGFLQMSDQHKLDGFWIHLDVDVLNDELMPAVDSRQSGGLTYAELLSLLIPLLDSGKAIGLDITILDPDLDPTGLYTYQFIAQLDEVWGLLKRK